MSEALDIEAVQRDLAEAHEKYDSCLPDDPPWDVIQRTHGQATALLQECARLRAQVESLQREKENLIDMSAKLACEAATLRKAETDALASLRRTEEP